MGAGALAIRVSRGWRPGREAGDWEAAMDRSRAVGSGRWLAGCSRLPTPAARPPPGSLAGRGQRGWFGPGTVSASRACSFSLSVAAAPLGNVKINKGLCSLLWGLFVCFSSIF